MMAWLWFLIFANFALVYSQILGNWIDPHELIPTDKGIFNKETGQCDCSLPSSPISTKENKLTITHYKRIINLLLKAVLLDKSDYSSYNGLVNIQMSSESYNYISEFAKSSDEEEYSLRKVDTILVQSLSKVTQEDFLSSVVSWIDRLYFTFYNRTAGIMLALIFMSLISYKLLRANLTIWRVMGYLLMIGWMVDFSFTWMKLLQEAEINKMAELIRFSSVPPNCDPNKMSIWSYMWSSLSSQTECKDYHYAMYKDLFLDIAPLTVLSHQFGIVIYTPASHIGKAIGIFSASLLNVLPFYAKIIVFPLLLIFSAVMVCIGLSFATGTSFSFNLLHLVQFRFGNHERRGMSDLLTGPNVRQLLNFAHRNAVEDVRVPNQNAVSDENNQESKLNDGPIIADGKTEQDKKVVSVIDTIKGQDEEVQNSLKKVPEDQQSKLPPTKEEVEDLEGCSGHSDSYGLDKNKDIMKDGCVSEKSDERKDGS